jgi:mycoredoxin
MTTNSKITMYGTSWCSDCRRAKRVFEQLQAAYEYVDIEQDDTARAYVEQVNRGSQSVPTITFPDGSVLVEPSSAVLTAKLQQLGIGAAS